MKFCMKCGKELADNAMFCSGCGAQQSAPATTTTPYAAPAAPAAPATSYAAPTTPYAAPATTYAPVPAKGKLGIDKILGFAGDIMAIVSGMMLFLSLILASYRVSVSVSKYGSINSYAYLRTEGGCALVGLVLGAGVLASGIVSLVFSIKNHEGIKALFDNIKKITLGAVLLVVGIVMVSESDL